ncbi:GH19622 [Drosophila grimshawi]|uniref:GH19622 n=1 Tax=Drosophila grimshawi TaxID=7222 RepID=B4K1D2_DROGR|nr:GH19622 [Drosophila grimshawi]
MLKDLLLKPQSTPPANVHLLTRVSPTLPPPSGVSGRPTEAMTTTPSSSSASGCISTALPMCRGVLDYDLTYNNKENGAPRDAASMEAYKQLINANCSSRAVEFVCASLEPECRPSHIGQLPPCRRICKAILEACSVVIANSDQLSELFDCSQYPDVHETHKCEDPTRRRDYCYDNEFQCHDGSCIPQQWQCDNIKDCAGGEDEDEQCLVCEHEEFRCRSNEKCIAENLRCDLNYDCFDASDEEDCDDYGSGDTAPFDEAELNAFPRIFSYASFLSPNETNEKLYTYITATTDEEAGTETKFQIHQVAAPERLVNSSSEEPLGGPKGFVNFRDSKEIMMTSDSENKFKYSSQRTNRTASKFSVPTATVPTRSASAIPTAALAQQREWERITMTTSSPTSSTTASTMATPTAAPGRCLPHELRCVSGKCITVNQLCDKQVDCPDAADEIMCVYRERPSARVVTTTTTTMRTTPTTTTTIAPTTTPTTTTTTRRSVRTNPNRSRKPKS